MHDVREDLCFFGGWGELLDWYKSRIYMKPFFYVMKCTGLDAPQSVKPFLMGYTLAMCLPFFNIRAFCVLDTGYISDNVSHIGIWH